MIKIPLLIFIVILLTLFLLGEATNSTLVRRQDRVLYYLIVIGIALFLIYLSTVIVTQI